MNRLFIVLTFIGLCASHTCAMALSGGGGDADGGRNIFDELNKKYDQQRFKIDGKRIDQVKKMLQDPNDGTPKGLVPKNAAAICPICRELLYHHGDPSFRCIPKDVDNNPLPMAEIVWKRIKCPVCQVQFQGPMPGNINNKNGLDRDFCMHSVGKACVHSRVWTCPDCGYAAQIETFGQNWDQSALSDETKDFVRRTVSPLMFVRMCKLAGIKEEVINQRDTHNLKRFSEYVQGGESQQDQINDWIKYDNAIKIYKHEKAPSVVMARLYLESAHACRRELNGEIAIPALHSVLEESLSFSIRRIQHDLTAATLQIRRERRQTSQIDPNHEETDPQILCDAAEMILKMGEVGGNLIEQDAARQGVRANPERFYTTGDLFVLCLKYAGFLDRLGRFEDADRALNKAKKFVPLDGPNDIGDAGREATEFIGKQLRVIREYVDDRKRCLQFEIECLNRAMWENLLAIYHNQVIFTNPNQLMASADNKQVDPAMTAYMLGELARRCNEPGAGPAFLAAADAIVKLQFTELDREEAALAPLQNTAPAKYAEGKNRIRALNERAAQLQTMIVEQRKLAKAGGTLDDKIRAVFEKVLKAAGIDPATFKIPELPSALVAEETINTDKPASTNAKPTAAALAQTTEPSNARGIKTREALYKMYYDAIVRYAKEKKSNPPSLLALVQANYISAENSCLDGKGNLICPETHDALLYTKLIVLGAKEVMIFQTNNLQKGRLLYANGEIGTLNKSK